ncbi:MAG: hypothetical protein SOY07_08490 [Bacteroidales bacterium]|nr:hypothetical protein [Bacteroidales bacterium]
MLSAFATSCDDDDDDDNSQPVTSEDGVVVNQKKLVKIVEYEEEREGSYIDIDVDSIVLRYDSKGRLIRWEQDRYEPEGSGFVSCSYTESYTWAENSITVHYNDGGYTGDFTYALSDNLVMEMADGSNPVTYQYDSDKRIVLEKETGSSYTSYSWDGDKLVMWNRSGDRDSELHYSGKTCKGYNPWVGLNSLAVAHPELFGCRTNQLPDYEIYRDCYGTEERYEYSYTFYSDGYLESVTKTYENGDYYKETYFWE